MRPSRVFVAALGAGVVAIACSTTSSAKPTPEDVAANAKSGDAITVEGTVFGVTFDNVPSAARDDFALKEDRWILIRSKVPEGVTTTDLDRHAGEAAFGLGVHLTPEQL